jgi:hypothetical protein
MYRRITTTAHAQAEHLDEDRERHRETDVALLDVMSETSAMSIVPISRRKLSASILIVGKRLKSGSVKPKIHDKESNSSMRIHIASARPIVRSLSLRQPQFAHQD